MMATRRGEGGGVEAGGVLGRRAARARGGAVRSRRAAPRHAPPPRRGRSEAGDHAHGGGLAGAVGAEESDDLPLLDGEGEVVNDGPGAVTLADRLEGDDRGRRTHDGNTKAPDRGGPSLIGLREAVTYTTGRPSPCTGPGHGRRRARRFRDRASSSGD